MRGSGAFNPAALPLLAAAGLLAACVAFFPWKVDDAWIVARYAERLAAGEGWTYQPGPPTDGVTAPAWALVGAVLAWLGWPVVEGLGVVGVVGAVASAALAVRAARRLGGARAAAVAAAVVAVQAPLAVAAVSGLSGGLAAWLLTAAGAAATARDRPRGGRVGASVGALAWLRPELALAGLALVATVAARDRRAGRRALALAATGALGVTAFRLALFGAPLPLSLAAKPAVLAHGVDYAARAIPLLTGLGGLVLLAGAARAGGAGRALVAVLAAHVVAVVLAGGDWMPAFRLFAPALPLYALACGLGAVRLARRAPLGAAVGWASVAAAVALPALVLVATVPEARAGAEARVRGGGALADALAGRARRVAMVDVGFVPWRANLEVVDLGGVVDPEVARLPGGHLDKRLPPGWIARRRPDAIVLHAREPPAVDGEGRLGALAGHPVERRLAADPWVRARFRVARVVRYAPGTVYVVLLPREPAAFRFPSPGRGARIPG